MHDVIVLGAGPAGLTAAVYSARSGYDVLVLDPMGPGGQLLVIDEIENYPGLEKTSGFTLTDRLEKQADEFGAKIDYKAAKEIKKIKNKIEITFTDGSKEESKALIIATGATHRPLGVPGEDDYQGKGVSYCATCDGPFFKGRTVAVVGGGDTALTDALYLSKLCKKVYLIHRRSNFRAQSILQKRVRERSNIKCIMESNIKRICGNEKEVTSIILNDKKEIKVDGVFVFIGIVPNSSFVGDKIKTDNGFIVTNEKMETSVEGIFAAGDVRTTPFRQVVTACGDGANAAHAADEYVSGYEKAIIKTS